MKKAENKELGDVGKARGKTRVEMGGTNLEKSVPDANRDYFGR